MTAIRLSLGCLKGLGRSTAQAIVDARTTPYRDMVDMIARVPAKTLNSKALDALINSGAMDRFGNRAQQSAIIGKALKDGKDQAKDLAAGQTSFFDFLEEEDESIDLPNIPELQERDRLIKEKEVLGFYLSGHPLAEYRGILDELCTTTVSDLDIFPYKQDVVLGGMISSYEAKAMKGKTGGMTMRGQFQFEDFTGSVPMVAWPEAYYAYKHLFHEDAIGFVSGYVDNRKEQVSIVLNHWIPVMAAGSMARCCLLTCDRQSIDQIKQIVLSHPGDRPVYLEHDDEQDVVWKVGDKCDLSAEFFVKVNKLARVRLIGASSKARAVQPTVKMLE